MHIKHERHCTHFSGPYSNKSIRGLLRSEVSSVYQYDRTHGSVFPAMYKIYCKCTLCTEKDTLPLYCWKKKFKNGFKNFMAPFL